MTLFSELLVQLSLLVFFLVLVVSEHGQNLVAPLSYAGAVDRVSTFEVNKAYLVYVPVCADRSCIGGSFGVWTGNIHPH